MVQGGGPGGLRFRSSEGSVDPAVLRRMASGLAGSDGFTAFGHLLTSPQFRTLAEFEQAIAKLGPDGNPPGMIYDEQRASVLWAISNREFVAPLARACADRRLVPIGRIDPEVRGQSHGHVLLANPEYTIPLLKAHDDDVMLGVLWWNGTSRGRGAGAEVFGVRMVCTNFNLWGSVLGRFRLTQLESPEAIFSQYERLLQSSLDRSSYLRGLVEAARDTLVVPDEVPDLLRGVGLSEVDVASIRQSVASWNPEIRNEGLNGWSVYNAATAYQTWGPNRPLDFEGFRHRADRLVGLLTTSHDRLIARGREMERLGTESTHPKSELEAPPAP